MEGTLDNQISAFHAFQEHLKTLCLSEFPCGKGKWRKRERPYSKLNKPICRGKVDKTRGQFSVTLTDYGARYEHTETLQEFVTAKHSPWTFDYSWSDEAKTLREIAVKTPESITEETVYGHFKTLRLIDKGIKEIDESFLKFSNLEELTLSANFIRSVNSKHLPKSLRVLELCANEIADLFSLCLQPPTLVHLGLGFNNLTYIDDFLSGENWPKLLSLDLSNNDLTDIMEGIRKLQTLPKLHHLVLQGNPCALSPGYRGFVVDSLKKLDILDDTRIEAEERHSFKGMTAQNESALNEALISFAIKEIKGIPMPDELKNPDEQPDFPVINRSYFVKLYFVEDESGGGDVYHIQHDDIMLGELGDDMNSSAGLGNEFQTPAFSDNMSADGRFGGGKGGTPQTNDGSSSLVVSPNPGMSPVLPIIYEPQPAGLGLDKKDSKNATKQGSIDSNKAAWAETIELDWNFKTTRYDLLALRDFMKTPMKIEVVEETILGYPKEEEGDENLGGSKEKDKKPSTPTKKKGGKEDTVASKKEDKKGGKGGKKGKEPEEDMRFDPPQYHVMATFDMSLQSFLDGKFSVEESFAKEHPKSRAASAVRSMAGSPANNKGKSAADKKGKDKGKPARAKSAGKKDGKKKDEPKEPTLQEEEEVKLPPLELDVSLTLHHWETTKEARENLRH